MPTSARTLPIPTWKPGEHKTRAQLILETVEHRVPSAVITELKAKKDFGSMSGLSRGLFRQERRMHRVGGREP